MKKIVSVITLLFAFTISANAQDSKISAEKAANDDAVELREYLGLSLNQQADFERLFQMKHEVMMDKDMSDERKKEMSRVVGLKIEASFDGDQIEKLKYNEVLWKKLTN